MTQRVPPAFAEMTLLKDNVKGTMLKGLRETTSNIKGCENKFIDGVTFHLTFNCRYKIFLFRLIFLHAGF